MSKVRLKKSSEKWADSKWRLPRAKPKPIGIFESPCQKVGFKRSRVSSFRVLEVSDRPKSGSSSSAV